MSSISSVSVFQAITTRISRVSQEIYNDNSGNKSDFASILKEKSECSNHTDESIELLKLRKLSEEKIWSYSDLMEKIKEKRKAGEDAKTILKSLSSTEMKLLQKIHGLSDSIKIERLSVEDAENLLN